MKKRITVWLNIIRSTNSCICLYSSTTSYFICSRIVTITTTTTASYTIKCMVTAKLVPHFMSYIINVKCITNRIIQTSNTSCLVSIQTNYTQACNSTAASTKYMAYVIVCTSNNCITICLVLPKHCWTVIICVGVSSSIEINKQIIISN